MTHIPGDPRIMITDHSRCSRFADRSNTLPDAERIPPDDALVASAYRRILVQADRACCCSAKPSVLAIMPPSPSRPHRTELLLCMHHYRASSRGLSSAHALIIGADGRQPSEIHDRECALAA